MLKGIVEGSLKYYCIRSSPLFHFLRKYLAYSRLKVIFGSGNFSIFLKTNGDNETGD
jgi:hypothetical protein